MRAQGRADAGAAASQVIAAAHCGSCMFLTSLVICRETAYDTKQAKRKRGREAVQEGTATDAQRNAREVTLHNRRNYSPRQPSPVEEDWHRQLLLVRRGDSGTSTEPADRSSPSPHFPFIFLAPGPTGIRQNQQGVCGARADERAQ
jgi:hypothetical protein